MIDRDALAVYLNDHLAGSVAALQMMDRICDSDADSALGRIMGTLRAGVESDQEALQNLLQRLDASESVVAKAVAWVGERVSRIKLSGDQADESGLMLFEAIETLTLGFHGRLALWNVLATLEPELRSGYDFQKLSRTVSEHITILEELRLVAGRGALTTRTPPHGGIPVV